MIKRMIVIITLLFTTTAFAKDKIKGEVEEIISGDTIIVETQKGDIKVKLYGVDAPEKNQDYGRESRKLLANLIDDENIKIKVIDIDDSETLIGKVYFDGEYINAIMLKEGAAWYDSEHANDKELKKAEELAKERERGIWKDDDSTVQRVYIQRKDHPPYIIDDDEDDIYLNINIFEDDHDHHKPNHGPHRRKHYDHDGRRR